MSNATTIARPDLWLFMVLFRAAVLSLNNISLHKRAKWNKISKEEKYYFNELKEKTCSLWAIKVIISKNKTKNV